MYENENAEVGLGFPINMPINPQIKVLREVTVAHLVTGIKSSTWQMLRLGSS